MMLPGIPALFINPYYLARKGLADHIREMATRVTGKTLDVGCGLKPYEFFCNTASYTGLELYVQKPQRINDADLVYDGYQFPFKNAAFDSIICNQVLEHVQRPDSFLSEIHRITKPGGHLLLTTPFLWGEHEKPLDFQRYTSHGIQLLLENYNFQIVTYRKSIVGPPALFALAAANLYERFKTNNLWRNIAVAFLLAAPLNLLGIIFGFILPENPDIYLDNIILGRKR